MEGQKLSSWEEKTLLPQRVSPFAFKNPSSSLLWVASLHPAVTVVPGHEFGISAWISSGLATNNHRKVVLDFFWTFSTLQQIFVPWCAHSRTPPLDQVITLWGKRGNWWNIKQGGGGNVAWDKSEWSWQSELPFPLQTVATQILFILRLPTPYYYSHPFYQHRERRVH